MSARKLIANADDFGISRGITDAIVDCHIHGIITSTTLMANMPAAEYACQRAKEAPALGVGVHLTLTDGRPVLAPNRVPDLVDEHGRFFPNTVQPRQLWRGERVSRQVESEFAAQIQRAIDLGIQPTHCDSHHSVHRMPLARAAMIKVLRTFGILKARTLGGYYWTPLNCPPTLVLRRVLLNLPLTIRSVGHHWNRWLLRRAKVRLPDRTVRRGMLLPIQHDPQQQLLTCLASVPPGISEMVFHPGFPDAEFTDRPSFADVRRIDAEICRDSEVIAAVRTNGVELISYREL